MRKTWMLLAAVVIAAPLGAQGGGMAGMNMDPTNKVVGSGKLPAGWMVRFDPVTARGGAPAPTPALTEISMEPMGPGYHIRSGPAGIYYNTTHMGTGNFEVSATFAQSKSMAHEAYGIFIGGANLQDSTQKYTYFVIKPCRTQGNCDPSSGPPLGEALINVRSSNARPVAPLLGTVANNRVTPVHHAAVVIEDPKTGAAKNKLTIRVSRDSVHFLANDKVVKAMAKTEMNGAPTEGLVGIRINHNVDVHIDGFGLLKR